MTPVHPNPLRRLWSIPEVEDPALRQEVRLLFGVTRPQILVYLAVAPLFFVPGVTVEQAALPSAAILALGTIPFLAALALAHGGRVALASWFTIGTALATQMAAIAMIGGLMGALAGSLVLSVLVAGILRGVAAASLTAGLAFAFAAVLFLLERGGWTPLVLPLPPPGAAFVTVAAVLAIAAALLALYARELGAAAETARESDRKALAAEQRVADLVREAPDGFAVLDVEGRLVEVNPAITRMTGFSAGELLGRRLLELPGISSDQVRAALATGFQSASKGGDGGLQAELVRKDGTPLVIETRTRVVERPGRPPEIHVVIRDVTARVAAEREKVRLEEDLRDARRMEMVGRLAGGIAHDFRNLLTPMLGNAALIAGDPSMPAGDVRALAKEIETAAARASDLTGQLLAYARRQLVQVRNLSLDEVLCEIEPILRRLIREDVRLEWELPLGLPAVRADRSQLEQVVVNLVANARDAMPSGGVVTVSTGAAQVGEAEAAAHPGSRPGPHVVLTVRDTGVGMTDEVREKVFDPFFTTKELGSGVGLGLATVHGIVAQAGGHIRVESQVGKGTAFRVYLPAAEGQPEAGARTPAPSPVLPGGTLALVVDDSDGPRSVVARVLRGAGLEVLEARDGEEALALARAPGRNPALLVTDVVMPGMQGPELARRLRELHPALRVVLVSGYADQDRAAPPDLPPGTLFLAKPFTPSSLVARASEALAS